MRARNLENFSGNTLCEVPTGDPKTFPLSLVRTSEKLEIIAFLTGKGLGKRLGDLGLHKGSVVQVLHRERSGASIVVHDNNRVAIGAGVAQMISVALFEDDAGPDCGTCSRT